MVDFTPTGKLAYKAVKERAEHPDSTTARPDLTEPPERGRRFGHSREQPEDHFPNTRNFLAMFDDEEEWDAEPDETVEMPSGDLEWLTPLLTQRDKRGRRGSAGEVESIQNDGARVTCWITVREGLRVKTVLDASQFVDFEPAEGMEFTYANGRATRLKFDMNDFDAEIDALESEWANLQAASVDERD